MVPQKNWASMAKERALAQKAGRERLGQLHGSYSFSCAADLFGPREWWKRWGCCDITGIPARNGFFSWDLNDMIDMN